MSRRSVGFKREGDYYYDDFQFKRGKNPRGRGGRGYRHDYGYDDGDDTDSIASTVSLTFGRGRGRGHGGMRSPHFWNYEDDDTDSVSSSVSGRQPRGWKKGKSWTHDAWTKWLLFSRWHFQIYFLEGKMLYFDCNFTEVCSRGSIIQHCFR